jgi:hypothetical protein
MRWVERFVSAGLLLILSLAIGCQAISQKPRIESVEEKTRIESPKDAFISKVVKERLLH